MKTTKIDKLVTILADNENHTVTSLRKRTGLASVSAAVRDLRNEGFPVYLNAPGEHGNRTKVAAYRMAA